VLILFVTNGPEKGRMFRIRKGDRIPVGRDVETGIRLADGNVSRRHAELRRHNGQWFIRDLGSRNGTYVNLVRITSPVRLCDGDQLILGSSLLSYCTVDEAALAADADPAGGTDLMKAITAAPQTAAQTNAQPHVADGQPDAAAAMKNAEPAEAVASVAQVSPADKPAEPSTDDADDESTDAGWLDALGAVEPYEQDDHDEANDAGEDAEKSAPAAPTAAPQSLEAPTPNPAPEDEEVVVDFWRDALDSAMSQAEEAPPQGTDDEPADDSPHASAGGAAAAHRT
jgi:pSer/pThr/pTyr-binding forkhead associated (FHA) protein